jgi:hypothetical protein
VGGVVNDLFDLTGHVALVTGGNSGSGLGLARWLARAGPTSACGGRRDLRARGPQAHASPARGPTDDFELLAVYLASGVGGFHTGDTIVVDGGYTAF